MNLIRTILDGIVMCVVFRAVVGLLSLSCRRLIRNIENKAAGIQERFANVYITDLLYANISEE